MIGIAVLLAIYELTDGDKIDFIVSDDFGETFERLQDLRNAAIRQRESAQAA